VRRIRAPPRIPVPRILVRLKIPVRAGTRVPPIPVQLRILVRPRTRVPVGTHVGQIPARGARS
jgi:hypothetical protein